MPVWVDEEDFKAVAEADDADEGHDAALEPEEAGEVERENSEDSYCCDDGGDHERAGGRDAVGLQGGADEEVEAEGRAEELCEVGGYG